MSHLYESTVTEFIAEAKSGNLATSLQVKFLEFYNRDPSPQEVTSWKNSLFALASVLEKGNFDQTHIIFLELQMPLSSARCDCMLTGSGKDGKQNAVVFELKQWEHAGKSAIRDTVNIGGKPFTHPSAQARSYVEYLKYYHEAFTVHNLGIYGCAYLHNMKDTKSTSLLRDPGIFGPLPQEYPIFFSKDEPALIQYLEKLVGFGKGKAIADLITSSGYKPSTKLLDIVDKAVQSNFEWRLLDEQLLVFNTIITKVNEAKSGSGKHLIIVRGGPGTGKSVLAIQLLAYAARNSWRVIHATGNKAFQTVLRGKTETFSNLMLMQIYSAQNKKNLPVKELFSTFADVAKLGSQKENELDLVIGDESHRLWDFRRNKFANMNKILSETPMIEEILAASRVTALFLDDNQSVRADEIGSVEYLTFHAKRLNVAVDVIDLNVQFRCSGSQSYVDWIDHTLGFNPTRSLAWLKYGNYDFQIMKSMDEMQEKLEQLRVQSYRCRMLAGFCWKWSAIQGNQGLVNDIQDSRFGNWKGAWIEKGDQNAAPLDSRYYKWATDEDYFSQVGSIYSVQGFEFDYIGLIFGEDLIWQENSWVADLSKNKDNVFIKDIRSSKQDPVEKLRNIYRVLLTRGMRGTYVYFLDAKTQQIFEELMREELAA